MVTRGRCLYMFGLVQVCSLRLMLNMNLKYLPNPPVYTTQDKHEITGRQEKTPDFAFLDFFRFRLFWDVDLRKSVNMVCSTPTFLCSTHI